MEAAGLAVGVVPLVVGILKAYSDIHQYLRTFKHYATEVKRLFNRFERQQCIFENELDIIIRKADSDMHSACSTSIDQLLSNANLNGLIGKLLDKHAATFENLLRDITEQLGEIQRELRCFEPIKAEQLLGESLKETVNRVKARVKIGFDKRRIQGLIDALRDDNDDLRTISSYLVAEQPASTLRKSVKDMPFEVLRNRAVMLALHKTLEACWTCIDPDHAEHVAKLCIDPLQASERQEVRRDLAVACLPKACTASAPAGSEPIWMYVRTSTEIAKDSKLPVKTGVHKGAVSVMAGKALTKNGSVCESLQKCQCDGNGGEACLSYSQPDRGLRHLFYHHLTPAAPAQKPAQSIALAEVLQDVRLELSADQQLELSRRLTLSVLELYQSPWLSEHWRTNEISSFAKPSLDETLFTQRLHVTSAIGSTVPVAGSQSVGALTQQGHWALLNSSGQTDAAYLWSISNSTLFSLGVALLEIAHGKRLEDCRLGSDPNLLCTAQRLAQRGCPLGERYRQLALQCLRCDFGCGSELENRGLQDAVYTDVVDKLGELAAGLRA